MPEHPCAEGLSAACFKAYPEYARKALAYKLLHQILPHQLTRMLPRMPIPPGFNWLESWDAWLYFIFTGDLLPWEYFPEDWKPGDPLPPGVEIDPGAVFPPGWKPGDPLPPGVVVTPGVVFPEGWKPGDPLPPGVEIDPGAVFPPGWKPGDPLPPGVVVTPGVVFPEGWKPGDPLPPGVTFDTSVILPPNFNPEDHPPAYFIPGYTPIPTPSDTGPEPPLYIPPFEPGPIGGSFSSAPYVFDIGELLVTQGSNLRGIDVGNSLTFFDLGMAIETAMHAQIHAIDIKIGRYNIPLDSIGLEIWTADSSYKPVLIVGSGSSNTKKGSTLSEYSTGLDYTRFLFTGTPELSVTNKYAVVIGRTGDVWTDRYYQVGEYQFGSRNYHYQLANGTWYIRGTSRLNCRIWGVAL